MNAAERDAGARSAGPDEQPRPAIHIYRGEAWADRALADLKAMEPLELAGWAALLAHCEGAKSGSPSEKWIKMAVDLLAKVGAERFRGLVSAWFPLVDKPRTQPLERVQWGQHADLLICEPHADILKGLAWYCGLREDAALARALMSLAMSSYKKVPGIGPRLVKVGNACVWALGRMPGMEGLGQLAILRVRVKFGTAQKLIEKALTATAERLGMAREDVDELGVPSYGMTEVGVRREPLGEHTAELRVTPEGGTELAWIRADQRRAKSVPAAVKKEFAADLNELRQAAKDIQRMLPAQRERIDQLYLQQKSWAFETWRERYLDHPLVGTLARRLIWRLSEGDRRADAIFLDGQLVSRSDEPIAWPRAQTKVELWHPIASQREEILGWRAWLEKHQVRQPFKQAHREVYLLTDAERATRVYSNRYAAHIIRQHQFNALCAARGWRNQLRLLVDQEFPPASRALPQWGLRAEFWIEGVGDDYGTDTNETGTFYRLTTDQVRFYAIDSAPRTAHASGGEYHTRRTEDNAEPIPLEQIPTLVFTEVMRDVDLFVGVASVGNDPTWADGGPQGRYRDYWQSYSFGELAESAKTRRQVLEHLVPRLKIAERCSLTERFLVVSGDLRTYKIHLGSGNILMEPDDQYLCIVKAPSRDGRTEVFLPFEGDGTLAIILSKAFLLADDTKITDPSITQQIGRHEGRA